MTDERRTPPSTKSHPGWHVLGGLLVLACAVILWAKFARPGGSGEMVTLSASMGSGVLTDSEQWLGVYSQGRKLGHIHRSIRTGEAGISLLEEVNLRVRLGGASQRIDSSFLVGLAKDLSLEKFAFHIRSNVMSAQAEGFLEDGRLVVKVRIGDQIIKRRLSLEQPPLFDLAINRLVARREPKAGERFRAYVFDPQALSNRPVQIEVVGPEVVKVQGGMQPAIHLRREVAGQQVDGWIDARGDVLLEQTAFGLMLRREDQQAAEAELADDQLATETEIGDVLRLLVPGSPEVEEER